MTQHADPTLTPTSTSIRLSIMMFLQFFIWGSWYVSMVGWMGKVELQGLGAWAYTVCPIAAVVSPFFLGIIADRFFATQRILGVLNLLGGAALLAVPSVVASANQPVLESAGAPFFHPYILILLAHALCFMPTLGLTYSLSFANMQSPQRQFPIVRTAGTVGWVVGNLVVGGAITLGANTFTWIEGGATSHVQWFVAGGASLLLGLYSFTLPNTPPPAAGKAVTVRQVLGLDSLKLLSQRSYLVFAICSFLLCIPLAGYYSNAYAFITSLTQENTMLIMSSGQMSEVFFMLLMPLMFRKLGFKWMLAAGMLAWMLRYLLFAGAAADSILWMAIAGVLLHGICYDFFFVTGSIYVDNVAPKHLRSQAQGFLVLITQGLGLGLGAIVFGEVKQRLTTNDITDWKTLWMYAAAFSLAVCVFFVLFFRSKLNDEKANGTS